MYQILAIVNFEFIEFTADMFTACALVIPTRSTIRLFDQ